MNLQLHWNLSVSCMSDASCLVPAEEGCLCFLLARYVGLTSPCAVGQLILAAEVAKIG